MSFRISGTNSMGALGVTATTAVEAVEKAVEMMGRGLSNVNSERT